MIRTSTYFYKLRPLLYVGVACVLFLSLERLCHLATEGFMVTRILHPIVAPSESSQEELQEELQEAVAKILSQPFFYLASGAQSYVFVSQNGGYVIKFFKFHHLRIPPWMSKIPLPKPLDAYREAKIAKKNALLAKTFRSYEIASSLLPKETALVYLHLYPTTHLHQSLHLVDKIGIHYELNADALSFVIQKRGIPLYTVLEDYINKGHTRHAKKTIDALLNLSIKRCKQGVGDLDPDFKTNFGLVKDEIAQLDVGRFYMEEEEKKPEIYQKELYRITRSLHAWLKGRSPELAAYLDEKLQGEPRF